MDTGVSIYIVLEAKKIRDYSSSLISGNRAEWHGNASFFELHSDERYPLEWEVWRDGEGVISVTKSFFLFFLVFDSIFHERDVFGKTEINDRLFLRPRKPPDNNESGARQLVHVVQFERG